MRALWKGAISFGLVTIPVSLYPATRREELKFRLLRKSDQSPVNYKRVAEADGKEVPWDQIVKGYEYEKDKFVVIKDEDFARVDVEATQTVNIINFVSLDEVNPFLFYKPYYLESGKGGDKAYVLLRDALIGVRQDRHRHGSDSDAPTPCGDQTSEKRAHARIDAFSRRTSRRFRI